jgi:glutamate dehydrogenase
VSPRAAVADIRKIDGLAAGASAFSLYRPLGAPATSLGVKVYRAGDPVVLSTSLPMLERMGVLVLTEHPAQVTPESGSPVWIHDFEVQAPADPELDIDALRRCSKTRSLRVMDGRTENDDFNRLVLRAALAAEDIVVLRAYAKYMKQIGFALSQAAIETTSPRTPGWRASW